MFLRETIQSEEVEVEYLRGRYPWTSDKIAQELKLHPNAVKDVLKEKHTLSPLQVDFEGKTWRDAKSLLAQF